MESVAEQSGSAFSSNKEKSVSRKKKIEHNKQKIGVIFMHIKLQGSRDGEVCNGHRVFFGPTYKLTELKHSECEQVRKRPREGSGSNYSTARPSRPVGSCITDGCHLKQVNSDCPTI